MLTWAGLVRRTLQPLRAESRSATLGCLSGARLSPFLLGVTASHGAPCGFAVRLATLPLEALLVDVEGALSVGPSILQNVASTMSN